MEKAVQALRDYHQWKIAGKEELVQQLRANLNSIKGRVLDLAEKYVEPISIMDEEEEQWQLANKVKKLKDKE